MPTNRILLLIGNELGKLREQGKLSDITYGLMDNKLDELAHVTGGCERLASTPVPFAYTLIFAAYRLSFSARYCPSRWWGICIT